MDIRLAQQEVQSTFLRGAAGQTVSGLIWLVSAALGAWVSERFAILVLVLGGMFIFPLTQPSLRLLGRTGSLPKGHPMNQLATQVAFIVPFSLPLIGEASLYNLNWFYPALMLVVGVHYLPFMFLYGMWEFVVLAGILIFGSVSVGLWLTDSFTFGGWFTAVVLLALALWVGRSSNFSSH